MATSAFRSSSRRATDPGGGGHQRSRSLSRYSGRFPPPPPETDEFHTPRGRFVNKAGSGFPEISLDDLADEFFGSKTEEEEEESRSGSVRTGMTGRRGGEARFLMETDSSRRRGRSVSRNNQDRPAGEVKGSLVNSGGSRRRSLSVAKYRNGDVEDQLAGEGKGGLVDRSGLWQQRRRRSLSVAKYRNGDVENDLDKFHGLSKLKSFDSEDFQRRSSNRQPNTPHGLRRSMSQKDLSQSLANYSSNSSSLTDDEVRDGHSYRSGMEKTISTISILEKAEYPTGDGDGPGLYEAMRNEVRNAVQQIRTELEKAVGKKEPSSLVNGDVSQPKSSNSINAISEIRRSYTCKLEESEKRKQDLLAELAAEEQRGQELTNIVRELLPAPTQIADNKKPLRPRRRSSDRMRMSKCLFEEAERYFEDFLSNVEDTDISSFDGERSDTSSTLGGSTKLRDSVHNAISETHAILAKAATLPTETDGVLLPWLQWETSDDFNPLPAVSNEGLPEISAQEASAQCGSSTDRRSSFGSWSPEGNDSYSAVSSGATGSRFGEVGSYLMNSSCCAAGGAKGSSFNMDEYLQQQSVESFLLEMLRQRQRLESGSLVLCSRRLI